MRSREFPLVTFHWCFRYFPMTPSLPAWFVVSSFKYPFSQLLRVELLYPCVGYCWELLRQLYCLDLRIGPPPPPRRKGGQKRATDTPFREQPQNVPALNQRQISGPHPDTTKFLLPRVTAKRKISTAPPLLLISTCTSPFACAFLLPHPSC